MPVVSDGIAGWDYATPKRISYRLCIMQEIVGLMRSTVYSDIPEE